MPSQFSETAPGGTVSGTKTVRRQSRGLIVEYALEWTGDDPVTIRLADRLSTADADEYGFHEDHAPSEWAITDGELDLEAELESGDERRLVFGLVADGVAADTVDREEPVVDVLDGASDDDGAEHAAADGPDVDLAVDLEEPGAEERGQPSGGPARGDASEGRRVDADGGVVDRSPDADGSVVSKLVAELEAGTVPESELSTLRDHLDDGAESEAVRLEYVQKRLSDFDAYVDALEDLISVHGSGDDAITDLDERLEDLADEVAAVRRRQDEMADRLEGLSEALDDHAEALESHRVTHEADVDDMRTEIRRRGEVMCEEFNDLQQSLDEDLAALEAEIEAFESIRRTLVDGLRRPADLPSGTTVEDADPGALEETEEIPIVDPGEAGVDGGDGAAVGLEATEDDPALEAGPAADGTADATASTADEPDVSVDLEESLERAQASNYSGSADPAEDDAARRESEADQDEVGQFDDEFVHPAPDGPGDVAADEGGGGSPDASDGAGEDDAGDDDTGDEADDGFLVPGPDVDAGDGDGIDEGAEGEDSETDVATRNDAPGVEAEGDGGDGDSDEGDAGDSDGRATSIFEIGDVGSDGSGDDEKPTIDFEDA